MPNPSIDPIKLFVTAAAVVVIAGCATRTAPQTAPVAPQTAPPRVANESKGEITGTPRPGSRFAKLKLGMDIQGVQAAMGHAPDRFDTYESGKRWIPFYFGADARRLQALYQGEGCLTFTHGNAWGGGGGELIAIEHDATGACYRR